MSPRRLLAAPVLAAVLTAGCLAEAARDVVNNLLQDCSDVGKTVFVADTMEEIYFWYREMPDVDPERYGSPEEYLEAVRYKPLDTSFSYITDKAADEALRQRSEYVGFGFGSRLTDTTELRVTLVYPGSPAAEAGLERGAFILEIDGRTVADLVATNQLGGAFGPSDPGVSRTVRFRTLDGAERTERMAKRVVEVPPVGATRIFTAGDRVVGYIELANFVEPGRGALDNAFAQLRSAGATELVLDLRYNGGGLVSIAQHLAGLIGGARTNGRILARLVHNDKNSSRNSTIEFPNPAQALGLERVFIITTRSSASASELMVNGLRPHVDVVQVGDASYGKPVGQYGYTFCDRVLYPVAFNVVNSRNEGDYFGGLVPDCAAPDDLSHALGDPGEASLAEALHYVRTGSCSAVAARAARAASQRRPAESKQPHRRDGWEVLVGAF